MKRFFRILNSIVVATSIAAVGYAGLPAQAAPSPTVVVQRVEVRSDGSLDRRFLDSLLDIETGEPIERPELDRAIASAEAKLAALGYFEKVTFTLTKGAIRDSYVLEVELAERSDHYVGTGIKIGRSRENTGFGSSNVDATAYNLFAGKRNLLGQGIKADLNLTYEETDDESARRLGGGPIFQGESRSIDATASAFAPSLGGSPLNFGMALWARRSSSASRSQSDISQFSSETDGSLQAFIGTLGASRGLSTVTFSAIRFHFEAESKAVSRLDEQNNRSTFSDQISAWRSNFGLQLKYSEKTRLVLVESGLFALASVSRTYAPEIEPTSGNLYLEYTWFWLNTHGVTPLVSLDYDWFDDYGLERYYNAGFRYEWVVSQTLAVGLEHGIYDSYGRKDADFEVGLPSKRLVLRISYLTPNLNLSFAFVYGEPGAEKLATRDFSDVTRLDL